MYSLLTAHAVNYHRFGMSSVRDRMIAALTEHVIPVLRDRGFSGSFPNFRRLTADSVHLLTFLFSKYGGSVMVEVGSCSIDGLPTGSGDVFPHPRSRLPIFL
jgi:hypothetical protein